MQWLNVVQLIWFFFWQTCFLAVKTRGCKQPRFNYCLLFIGKCCFITQLNRLTMLKFVIYLLSFTVNRYHHIFSYCVYPSVSMHIALHPLQKLHTYMCLILRHGIWRVSGSTPDARKHQRTWRSLPKCRSPPRRCAQWSKVCYDVQITWFVHITIENYL